MHAFGSDAGDAAVYRQACRDALRDRSPDLAIVITSEAQEHLTGDDSPYLVAKSAFLGQGVPVQDVQIETMRQSNLAYALNSIALACYAKLGGIPFVLAAPRTLAHELVIGIGSAHVKASRLTAPERVVGVTAVFSADGNYLLSNTSREADYADYPRELSRSLTECITDIEARNAWQKGDELRLVFHVFKPLKDTEVTAVKALVDQLVRQYAKVEFAFVHVSTEHDWVMFDRDSPGVGSWGDRGSTGAVKGRYVPERGHAVPIGTREMLLSTGGPRDLKSALHGVPKPLLLKVHPLSTFTDIEYLARQAYRFTSMSWRTMYPSRIPVTILYSDLIANLLGHLRHVKNWNADTLTTPTARQSMVPVADHEPERPDPAGRQLLTDHLAGLEYLITRANLPGHLDGLLAHHILASQPVSFNWNVDPMTQAWFADNAHRLDHANGLAVLGYGLTSFPSAMSATARDHLLTGVPKLMRRNPVPPDGVTFVNDPDQVIGIALAVNAVHDDLPHARAWLAGVLQDSKLRPATPLLRILQEHARHLVRAACTPLDDARSVEDPTDPPEHEVPAVGHAL